MTLRPIGEEYWQYFPANPMSLPREATKILYRVTGHIQAARFDGDKDGVTLAEVQPIRILKAPVVELILKFDGSIEEVLGEWEEK